MTGIDYHSHFMERASLNFEKYQTHMQQGTVKFRPHDYIKDDLRAEDGKYDLLTFGFEVSLDVLRQRQSSLETGAHILVPLSEVNDEGGVVSLEQDFCLLKFSGPDQFDVVKKIMRTSFSQRIDRDQIVSD